MEKTKERKLPPAGAGGALALLLAVLPEILLAGAGDIYRNDFSTRTSALPLPGDRWMSYDYDPNTMLYNNYTGASVNNLWENNKTYQDAWGKAWMDNATMQQTPGFALATDSVHGSPDNHFALFRSSSSRSGSDNWKFRAYDMGTAHPEIDAPAGPIVATCDGIGARASAARARELIESFGLANRRDNLPSELSGGQQQRVAIARALANRPELLFADEPTAALDSALGRLVMEMLRDVAHEHQAAVLVVTHDTRALDVFDRVLKMEDGCICGQ